MKYNWLEVNYMQKPVDGHRRHVVIKPHLEYLIVNELCALFDYSQICVDVQ